jgi:hypothetical protein
VLGSLAASRILGSMHFSPEFSYFAVRILIKFTICYKLGFEISGNLTDFILVKFLGLRSLTYK